LYHSHDVLARVHDDLGKGAFENLEKSYGVVFTPDGLLADLDLRAIVPPSTYVRDPMHVMLSGGVANVEIYAFLRSVSRAAPGFSWKGLRDFASAAWLFPGRSSHVKLADVFSDSRETASKSAEIFKAGASEVLSVYPILRYFAEVVVATIGSCEKVVASFLACCTVLDLSQMLKVGGQNDPALVLEFKNACSRFLGLHVFAYGREFAKPKHHYLLHCSTQYEEDGKWLDCFVHERKHQVIKAQATDVKNTRSFERSVLMPVCNSMLHLMEGMQPSGLTGPTSRAMELDATFAAPVSVAARMTYAWMQFSKGDVLWECRSAVMVLGCVSFNGGFGLLVEPLRLLNRPSSTTSVWTRTGDTQAAVLEPHLFRHANAWFTKDDGSLVVLGLCR